MIRKITILIYIFITTLSADLHISNKSVYNLFLENVKNANFILKNGEYERFTTYRSDMNSLLGQIKYLQIPDSEKEKLSSDINSYFELVNQSVFALQKKAPNLNRQYKNILNGLQKFNKSISSIGLYQLSSEWLKLSKIKNDFVNKPSIKLKKDFENSYNSVIVIITELYLDSDMEDPMFDYLREYKTYFESMVAAYEVVNFKNIAKLKPMSYKIKADLELL